MSQEIINGDCVEQLRAIDAESIDAVVTDPPYGIAFLGKDWDTFRGTKVAKNQLVKNLGTGMRMTTHKENLAYQQWCQQWAAECLRVLKPGGYLLAFSAARLYHRISAGIEDAGFEIRDQLMWLYASGFPKAQDIGKAIQKRQGVEKTKDYDWNRPVKGGRASTQDLGPGKFVGDREIVPTSEEAKQWSGWKTALKPAHEPICMARKPFKGSAVDNVLEHGVGALNIDASRIPYENAADEKTYKNNIAGPLERSTAEAGDGVGLFEGKTGFKAQRGSSDDFMPTARFPSNVMGEIPAHQKYFYCPKVSKRERMAFNTHPTVKPKQLMKYLLRLVAPAGAHIVDPFCGSGSTGMACKEMGLRFTGIDKSAEYCDIARRRLDQTKLDPRDALFG